MNGEEPLNYPADSRQAFSRDDASISPSNQHPKSSFGVVLVAILLLLLALGLIFLVFKYYALDKELNDLTIKSEAFQQSLDNGFINNNGQELTGDQTQTNDQTTINTDNATITAPIGSNATIRLGDSNGYTSFVIQNSNGIDVASINSIGNVGFDGKIICTNCITLGSETTGNYVKSISSSGDIAVVNGFGEGSSPIIFNLSTLDTITQRGATTNNAIAINSSGNALTFTDPNAILAFNAGAGRLYDSSGSLFYNGINLTSGGSLPTGISGQTLRHNGTGWVANSILYNDGTNVGIGTTTPTDLLTLVGPDGTQPYITFSNYYSLGSGPVLRFRHARGTASAPLVSVNGDRVGDIIGQGYSGAAGAFLNAAYIRMAIDGAPDTAGDTSDMPGMINFWTTPDGSGTATERMRINNAGFVGIGTTAPTYQLETSKTVKAGTAMYANTRALDFDGSSSDYINIGDITELNSTANFTISTWIKPDAPLKTGVFLTKNYSGAGRVHFYISDTGRYYLYIQNPPTPIPYGYTSTNTAVAGRFQHVSVVYDGAGVTNTDKLKLYIDGVQISLSFIGTIPAVTADLSGGDAYISAASSTAFDGQVQDFRIYSSSVSASDIATIYQGGTYTTNMVHQYKLMEGTGTVATDTGSNVMDGTISGATWSTTNNVGIQTDFGRGALTLAPNTTNAKDGLWFGYENPMYRVGAGEVAADFRLALADGITSPTTSAYGLTFGGATAGTADVNLYRSADDQLKTDDSLVVSGKIGIGTTPNYPLHISSASGGSLALIDGTAAGDYVSLIIKNAGDSNIATTAEIRVAQAIRSGGKIVFGRENANNWTAVTSNADGFISLNPVLNNVNTERLRVDSAGLVWFDSGVALDTNLYRSAANILSSDDKLDPASLNLQTKAGIPADGDITGGAADGDIVLDTSNNRIYTRTGGSWMYAALSAGFQIPNFEAYTYDFTSKSFDISKPIKQGDLLIPFADYTMSDGAIHGLYTTFDSVKQTMFDSFEQDYDTLANNYIAQKSDNALTKVESNTKRINTIELSLNDLTNRVDGISSFSNYLTLLSPNLTVEQNDSYLKLSILGSLSVNGSLSVEGDASFGGIIEGNSKFVGREILIAGEKEIKVERSWESAPKVINATPSYNVKVWLEDITKDGFIMQVDEASDKDQEIYWTAIWSLED